MASMGGGRLLRVLGVTLCAAGIGLGCQGPVSYQQLREDEGRPANAVVAAYRGRVAQGDPGLVQAVAWTGSPYGGSVVPVADPATGQPPASQRFIVNDPSDPYHIYGSPPGMVMAEAGPPELPLPTEKAKTYLPPYVIEPPDVLYIDAIRMIPKPPYRIQPLDVLLVQLAGETLPGQPVINGPYSVTPDGTINLGGSFGAVRVVGLTLEQAAQAIRNQLRRVIKEPRVGVALASFQGVQQVRGEHLVSQDGTIPLGTYGAVCVAGLTVPQAKCAIEKYLSKFLQNPEISISVAAYNSKFFYVIADGAGFGEQVYRFPITGNETVLDAIGAIRGIPPMSSKKGIWVARPTPANHSCYEILPVDWNAIAQGGDTTTNYQLMPGDRVYLRAAPLIKLNNTLTKVLAPIEQIMGVTLLGAATVETVRIAGSRNLTNGNNTGVGGIGFIR